MMTSRVGSAMMFRKKKRSAGFSLVELLTVIAIIGILASMTMMAVSAAKRRAHIAKAEGEVRELIRAWNVYWITFGEWPDGLKGATNAPMNIANMAYLRGGNDMGLYLIDVEMTTKGFLDPWGNPYMVDFSQTQIPGQDVYEACVALPLRRRYKYENM